MSEKKNNRHRVFEPSYYHTTIKQWPESERPREKLLQYGSAALSEAELIAILIRTGSKGATAVDLAKKLLSDGRTLRDVARMSVHDLESHGIGRARATSIVAAFELTRRLPLNEEAKLVFRTPEDVANRYIPKLRDLKHEEFWSLLLSASNQLINEIKITSGILNSSLVHPRECFHHAIKEKAACVIFIHNHPSGNPEPSPEDKAITQQLVEAGKILGIPVHDHIIVAGGTFTSFADKGLMK
ncbi:MAG: DNA repair protein RadC [Ignavibacteriales bacterium]|nr:DNA repair protein RadC [Ignavibacteriales bacterium]